VQRRIRPQLLQHGAPIHPRHQNVKQHDVRSALAHGGKRGSAIQCLTDPIPARRRSQHQAEKAHHLRIVVDDEHVSRIGANGIQGF
jgi:hypothetical protein